MMWNLYLLLSQGCILWHNWWPLLTGQLLDLVLLLVSELGVSGLVAVAVADVWFAA